MTEAAPYTTQFGNTVADFENFHDGAQGGNPITLERTLRVASRIVRNGSIAPEPDAEGNDSPNLPDYLEAANDAELMVARWIWDTDGGATSSESSVVNTSKSYQSNPKVLELIGDAMGEYAKPKEEAGGGDSGIARVSRSPF